MCTVIREPHLIIIVNGKAVDPQSDFLDNGTRHTFHLFNREIQVEVGNREEGNQRKAAREKFGTVAASGSRVTDDLDVRLWVDGTEQKPIPTTLPQDLMAMHREKRHS